MSRRPSSTKKMITEIMIFNRIKFRYIRIMQNDYIIRLRTYRAEEPYIFRSAAHYGITNDSPDQAELLFPFHSHHSTFVFNSLAITLHHHSLYIYIYIPNYPHVRVSQEQQHTSQSRQLLINPIRARLSRISPSAYTHTSRTQTSLTYPRKTNVLGV